MDFKIFERFFRYTSLFHKFKLEASRLYGCHFASVIDSRKSTIGFVYTLGNTVVYWALKLQKIVALSTIKVEYVAVTEAGKEMVWLQSFLDELSKKHHKGTIQ